MKHTVFGVEHVKLSFSHECYFLQEMIVSAQIPLPVIVIVKYSQSIFVEHRDDGFRQCDQEQHSQLEGKNLFVSTSERFVSVKNTVDNVKHCNINYLRMLQYYCHLYN